MAHARDITSGDGRFRIASYPNSERRVGCAHRRRTCWCLSPLEIEERCRAPLAHPRIPELLATGIDEPSPRRPTAGRSPEAASRYAAIGDRRNIVARVHDSRVNPRGTGLARRCGEALEGDHRLAVAIKVKADGTKSIAWPRVDGKGRSAPTIPSNAFVALDEAVDLNSTPCTARCRRNIGVEYRWARVVVIGLREKIGRPATNSAHRGRRLDGKVNTRVTIIKGFRRVRMSRTCG